MAVDARLIAPFESEKHSLMIMVCDFRDKAYLLICCEAKTRTNASEMLWSQRGVVK
jgi:hypothetical protein